MRFRLRKIAILVTALWIAAASFAQTGEAWPEADKLFHSDPRWLGSDAAFSIDLGHGRVLWIFNDTFVARKPGDSRSNAAFVRNTVAIQTGYDPSRANIKFYWRTKGGRPSEIFPLKGQEWLWPGSGIRVGDKLLLFCDRVAPDRSKDSLGFKSAGWNAYWVMNPDEEPTHWKWKLAANVSDTVIMASQVLNDNGFIYLFGHSEPEHDLYMARSSVESFAKGDLSAMEWWCGGGWQASAANRCPTQLAVGTDTSLQPDPKGTGYIEIDSRGFGASDIVMLRSQKLEGPWSAPQMIYRPPESDEPDAFVYAGKSHAELAGADLILTYATNGFDTKDVVNMNRYFPRFVKVELPNSR